MTTQPRNGTRTRFRYLQVSPRDAEWGLYVTTMGWAHVGKHEVYPPAEHPGPFTLDWERGRVLKEYQIVSVTQGGGVLDTKDARHRIHKGDVMLLTPGMWHRYKPHDEIGWHESWVGFGGSIADQIFQRNFLPLDRHVVHLRPEWSLKNEFQVAAALLREAPVGMQQTLAAHVLTMLATIYAATLPATRRSDREDHVIERALEALRREEDISLAALAAELEVSYSWFRRAFREHVGMSPHQYRLHLQATRAQTLLRSTEYSVREIALRTGFRTEQYFCRLFKRHTGRTPLEFRRSARG